MGKIERRQIAPSAQFRAFGLPMQSPRDHQVDHQPQLAIQPDRDPLADPPQLLNDTAFRIANRRLRRPQQEGAADPHMFERLTNDARGARIEISGDIWQFRHVYQLAISMRTWQACHHPQQGTCRVNF